MSCRNLMMYQNLCRMKKVTSSRIYFPKERSDDYCEPDYDVSAQLHTALTRKKRPAVSRSVIRIFSFEFCQHNTI